MVAEGRTDRPRPPRSRSIAVVHAYTTHTPLDPLEIYRTFVEGEDDRSGTVVLHHGRVKRPGKVVPEFSWVELRPEVSDPDRALGELAREARTRFDLHRVTLVHRLGRLGAGDAVLVAVVSGRTRDRGFDGCRYLVDEVKREEAIRLVEHP